MTLARQRIALTAGLTVLVALAAASATTLGPAARRMPLVVALPTLALLVLELTRHVRAARVEADDPAARRVETVTFAWLGGLVAGVWLLGMLAGLPLFGVLDYALGIQMHDGLLGSLLGRWRS